MKKYYRLAAVLLVLTLLSMSFAGCDQVQNLLKKNEEPQEPKIERQSFLKVYEALTKEMKKKADDALLTGAIMMKSQNEPWDGKASAWSAGFYSKKNNKAYIVVWDKGQVSVKEEKKPEPGIEKRVITGQVSVDSPDALEIAKATMITQVDAGKAEAFKSLLIAYSNSLKKHVWAVSFDGGHRILVDAVTGEVLEAK
jgi:hypothetical protein